MPDRQATLEMMGGMLEQDSMPFSAQADAVTCRACRLPIDRATGDPLQPVTQDNVEAVRKYMQESGQAELGGRQLETSLDGLIGG